jgi:CRP-like cAMP-binding protein
VSSDESATEHRPVDHPTPSVVEDASAITQDREQNLILRAIPPEEYAWLAPRLETVQVSLRDVLAESGQPWRWVYFPETAIASVLNRMSDGGIVEVGTIGREGMVGLAVLLDAEATPSHTIGQVAGTARRLAASTFSDGARERPQFQRLLHRYAHAYLTQVSQTAACNRLHDVERRCARWLLMTHDRVGEAPEFEMTHEFLSFMLGVRRAGVSDAMGGLQDAGIVSYRRGKVRVLDRAGLEASACECYGIVRRHFDRLLP